MSEYSSKNDTRIDYDTHWFNSIMAYTGKSYLSLDANIEVWMVKYVVINNGEAGIHTNEYTDRHIIEPLCKIWKRTSFPAELVTKYRYIYIYIKN